MRFCFHSIPATLEYDSFLSSAFSFLSSAFSFLRSTITASSSTIFVLKVASVSATATLSISPVVIASLSIVPVVMVSASILEVEAK